MQQSYFDASVSIQRKVHEYEQTASNSQDLTFLLYICAPVISLIKAYLMINI